jgi:hypothetical protein
MVEQTFAHPCTHAGGSGLPLPAACVCCALQGAEMSEDVRTSTLSSLAPRLSVIRACWHHARPATHHTLPDFVHAFSPALACLHVSGASVLHGAAWGRMGPQCYAHVKPALAQGHSITAPGSDDCAPRCPCARSCHGAEHPPAQPPGGAGAGRAQQPLRPGALAVPTPHAWGDPCTQPAAGERHSGALDTRRCPAPVTVFKGVEVLKHRLRLKTLNPKPLKPPKIPPWAPDPPPHPTPHPLIPRGPAGCQSLTGPLTPRTTERPPGAARQLLRAVVLPVAMCVYSCNPPSRVVQIWGTRAARGRQSCPHPAYWAPALLPPRPPRLSLLSTPDRQC